MSKSKSKRRTDKVSRATRSRIMSSVRSKNSGAERKLRSLLHGAGFRYRLHRKDLPGTPDLYFARQRVAIFVHGCF